MVSLFIVPISSERILVGCDDVEGYSDDGVGGHDDSVGDDNQDRLPMKFHMSFIKMTMKMLRESKS